MISSLKGELVRVVGEGVELSIGPATVHVLTPAADAETLAGLVGQDVEFATVFYLEGDASGGNLTPRLIGFLRPGDRGFFEQFITVKGIGPKKALRALAVPASEIAAAIESRDIKGLTKLPQIGKRAAEQIIATLSGKVAAFAGDAVIATPSATAAKSSDEEDAIATLVALGEKRADAEALLDRARKNEPDAMSSGADAIVQAMLRARGRK